MRSLIIIIALLLAVTDDPSKKGRKGNESYKNEQHSEAAQLYREGIESGTDAKPGILAGLWNNLGASLFRSGDFQQAKEAFSNAIGFARSDEEVSKFAYNTGNTIYSEVSQGPSQQGPPGSLGMAPQQGVAPQGGGQGLQEALEFYKQSLLADPTNEDAKYNYEFVKRQLDEQQNQDQNQENQENQDQQQNQDEQNQDQQDQQQNQDQQENQDQQQQNQQDQQQQNQEQNQEQQQQEQQQQQQQQTDPTKLSREEAERILQALQNEEQELLRQVMKPQARPKKVDKDW